MPIPSRLAAAPTRLAIVSVVLLVGLVCLLGWSAPPVAAHAFLEESDPEPNAILANAPSAVTMRFTEPLERSYTKAELYDQHGNLIPDAVSREGDDDYTMVLNLPPGLADGTYSVLWRTLSTADGHTAQGYFAFTVGSPADVHTVVPPAITEDAGAPPWLKTTARWAALLGLAAALAIWPIWIFVLRPAISPAWHAGPALVRRVRRYGLFALALALAGNVFALLVQAAELADGGYLDRVRNTLGETRYGQLWLARMGLLLYAVALMSCAWWWPHRRRTSAAIALILAIALPLPFSLIAHASALQVGRSVAIAADVLHLLAASLWVGGLFMLATVLLPTLRQLSSTGRRAVLGQVLPRFSFIALAAGIVMGWTGLYSAWLQVGSLEALRDTAYGRSLTLKLLLLMPILALAAFNLLVVARRLKQEAPGIWTRRFALAVGTEAVLVVIVLLVVGRLTWQPPARDASAVQADWVTLDFTAEERQATLFLSPGAAGPNHFRLEVDGEPLPAETEALLRVELPAQETGEKELSFDRMGGNTFEYHGSELSISGDWDLELILRQPGAAEWRASEVLPIGATPPEADVPSPAWRFAPTGGIAGLVLVLLGSTGLAVAWQAGRTPLRKESAGLGAAAIALGVILLL